MSKHDYVREQFKTEYGSLMNNTHFIIYCRGCGYVSYNSNYGDNEKRQENLPPTCTMSQPTPTTPKKGKSND